MPIQNTKPALFGRAARMLLVFLLVFGLSFRVEMAMAADIPETELKGHEEGTLTNLVVCQITDENTVDTEKGVVRSLNDEVKEEPTTDVSLAYGASVRFAAAPEWNKKIEEAAAKFVKWNVNEEEVDNSVIELKNDGSKTGVVEVKCSIPKEALPYRASDIEKVDTITFTVTMEAAPEPEPEPGSSSSDETTKIVGDLQCVLAGAGLAEKESTLTLSKEEGANYQLIAKVNATINTADSSGNVIDTENLEYSSDEGVSLAEKSGGLLQDPKWELRDADKNPLDESVATIDATGLLKVAKDSTFSVVCTVSDANESVVVPFELSVTCGKPGQEEPESSSSSDVPEQPKADQGEDHHQDSLHVTGRVPSEAAPDSKNIVEDEKSSSSSASSTSTALSDNSTESSSSSSTKKSEVVTLDKTYSYEDVKALGSSEQTFSLNSEAAGSITVTGVGSTLDALLTDLGIQNLQAVNEIKFVDYADREVSISWSSLAGAMVATDSYVHNPEPEGGEGSSGNSSSSTEDDNSSASSAAGTDEGNNKPDAVQSPLPNTRFRILAEGLAAAGVDADSLRWIKEIVINPGTEVDPKPDPEPEPEPEAPFTVKVAYTASPLGQEAVFWPIPSKEIAGATFEYTWQESSDEGQTWEDVSSEPTYRTITTEDRIGHQFRVILTSDKKDDATGKPLRAISEPVTMREGWGVSLIFDPPAAGDIALFQVKFIGFPKDFDSTKLEYIWEFSQDGGKTWNSLPKSYQGKSTLSIQTDPIDKDSEESKEDAIPTYIQCRLVGDKLKEITGEDTVIAGPQMLTVRTDSEPGNDKEDPNKPSVTPINPIVDDPRPSPSSGSGSNPQKPPENPKPKSQNSDITDTPRSEQPPKESTEQPNPSTSSPNSTQPEPSNTPKEEKIDPSQIHINEEMTEKIHEQQEAVQKQIEETVPGARWTTLSGINASGDDVHNILSNNPFAPFAIPTGLGLTAAGALEKFLFFRRQLK